MSPTILIFLPLTLLLLMYKGLESNGGKPSSKQPATSKVMGFLTEDGEFIPLSSGAEQPEGDSDSQGIVIEQNGQRYLLSTQKQ